MIIIFVTASLNSGGSERVMSLLANSLAQGGHDVEIVCVNKPIVFYPIETSVKVWLVANEIGNNSLHRKAAWLRKHVETVKPDVVIAFMTSVYCMTLASLAGIRVPVITSERIDPCHSDFFRKLIRMLILPLTSHHVVQTEHIRNYYPSFIRKKTSIIYNPVNDEVFKSPDGLQVQGENAASSVQSSNTPIEVREEVKLNRIISVGRLTEQKNQEMMIRAFAKVSDKFPDWQLVIYGEGPMRGSLELIVDSLEMQDRVLLPGRTEHVIEELRKSKIFCLSSDFEGMSNAMIEAICTGLPIVITNVSGVSELVEDGKSGYVVPCGDVEQLALALQKVMSNSDIQETMSEFNLKKADMFKLGNIVDQWELLIQKVVQDSK